MPRKKIVDNEKLIKAVDAKVPAKEIMAKFSIKTTAQLKALYLDALVEKGNIKGITGKASKDGLGQGGNQIKVNKRGSLIVPSDIIETMGFQVGDQFSVRKTKSGVSIKRI
ncbi:MAG: hypothetical protein KKB20_20840 [Proteobacteria bacterium]|nr:hypothetical protein [Pseudomonadota bacterium]